MVIEVSGIPQHMEKRAFVCSRKRMYRLEAAHKLLKHDERIFQS